uniref:Putative ovule protein n=1 Tax=Solanum chacoense TaxID=4108 RepID=A0A0V0GHX5_SOLCH
MFNTTSIDECCPTFNSILGTSCPCYKYAEDLDNQVLITLESYCNVNNPCNGVQAIKLSKDDE